MSMKNDISVSVSTRGRQESFVFGGDAADTKQKLVYLLSVIELDLVLFEIDCGPEYNLRDIDVHVEPGLAATVGICVYNKKKDHDDINGIETTDEVTDEDVVLQHLYRIH